MRETETNALVNSLGRALWQAIVVGSFLCGLTFVLLGDYNPYSLAAILGLAFVGYLAVRLMIFWENEGFSPNRIQVGLGWVFLGIHSNTNEFDTRPVRTYCAILILLLLGVVVRPFLRFAIWGTSAEAIAF